MTQPDCNSCQHCGKAERARRDAPATILTDCRHPDVGGLMCCESCKRWNLMELFQLVVRKGHPAQLRCPSEGCRHVQPMPDRNEMDWRTGFVGARPAGQPIEPPSWCPGFEPQLSAKPADQPKPQKLTKKQKREAAQPCLF